MTTAKKRFGQHFLNQPSIIQKIIENFALKPKEPVIEIGPGQGALTKPLLAAMHPVIAIEIDRDMIEYLESNFSSQINSGQLKIIKQDVLTTDPNQLCQEHLCNKIVGNLPYNISTPILFHLLEANNIKEMTFMLQKEVVTRIAANPNCKEYGRLSVMVQQACRVESLFDIKPSCFTPPPKVMSSIVKLIPYGDHNPYIPIHNYKNFADTVRFGFGQRRKTLRNAMKALIPPELWQDIPIDPQLRAENLSINDFINISNKLDR